MTEDYIRGALLRGLLITEPTAASRVGREEDTSYADAPCHWDPKHIPGLGRPVQHDVAVAACNEDAGLVCEVKWLAQQQTRRVAADIWKLAMSRSTDAENVARRTYLLIGGESGPFSAVLRSLRRVGLNLRWSAAGADGKIPQPTMLSLKRSLRHSVGLRAWTSAMAWGSQPHYREAPMCWATVRASVRGRWLRTVQAEPQSVGWRIVLWELDHRGVDNEYVVDWDAIYSGISNHC